MIHIGILTLTYYMLHIYVTYRCTHIHTNADITYRCIHIRIHIFMYVYMCYISRDRCGSFEKDLEANTSLQIQWQENKTEYSLHSSRSTLFRV